MGHPFLLAQPDPPSPRFTPISSAASPTPASCLGSSACGSSQACQGWHLPTRRPKGHGLAPRAPPTLPPVLLTVSCPQHDLEWLEPLPRRLSRDHGVQPKWVQESRAWEGGWAGCPGAQSRAGPAVPRGPGAVSCCSWRALGQRAAEPPTETPTLSDAGSSAHQPVDFGLTQPGSVGARCPPRPPVGPFLLLLCDLTPSLAAPSLLTLKSLSEVLFSCSVVSNSSPPHGLWHARLPCPSPSP